MKKTKDAVASYLGVRDGAIRRNPRMSVARPVDLGIDPGVLAAEIAKFVAAAERREAKKARRRARREARRAKKARRRARAAAAAAGAGLGAGVFESAAAPSVAAEERSAAAGQETSERAAV